MTRTLKPFTHSLKVGNKSPMLLNKLFALTLRVISWLLAPYRHSSFVLKGLTNLALELTKIAKCRGVTGLIEYMKLTRLGLLHYLSGEYPSKIVPGIELLPSGLPKVLEPFEDYLDISKCVDYKFIRALLTLLYSTRALSIGKIPTLDSITNLPSGVVGYSGQENFNFWRTLGFRQLGENKVSRQLEFKNYHFTSKSGPNGQALITSIADLDLIKDNPILMESISIVGGPKLAGRMTTLLAQFDFLKSCHPKYPSHRLRKISFVKDKEVKVRVVAILDYFSQAALYPFHKYLYKILRRIPQDCTFDQGSFTEKTRGWTEYHSVDLTNATDRFPIDFCCDLFKPILSEAYVKAWKYIMVGLPFEYLDPKTKRWNTASYAVGTPMGAYTSWASFAVAHHFIMYLCCQELGLDWNKAQYVLLGDDVVIGHPELARLYKARIKSLGVEFSPIKTHVSQTLFEFAKRLFLNGKEITPFPMNAVWSSSKYYDLLPVFYGELKKGWNFEQEVAKVIKSYYEFVKGFGAEFCTRIYYKAAVAEKLMLYMRGLCPAMDVITSVYRQVGKPIPGVCNEDDAASSISLSLQDLFLSSDPANDSVKKCGKPLGLLAETMVLALTASEDDLIVMWACDAISCVPVLNVYGQISELYTELRKHGSLGLTQGRLYWPTMLKTIGLPLSDAIFTERQRDRLARTSSHVAYRLYETCTKLLGEKIALQDKYGTGVDSWHLLAKAAIFGPGSKGKSP